MTTPTHIDCRNAASGQLEFRLTETGLAWNRPGGEPVGEMAFSGMRLVRLAVEMAGQASQVVCRIRDEDGREIVFGSMRWTGPGRWELAVETFQILLHGLHAELLPYRGRIDFLEGQTMGFMLAMFIGGALIAALCLGFFVLLFFVQEKPISLLLLPGVAAGVWMMRLFKPRRPQPYDPERYAGPPASLGNQAPPAQGDGS